MIKKNILFIFFLAIGGFVLFNYLPMNKQVEEVVEKEPEVKMIALSEIEEHAVETDCWQAIEGKVYDFTDYIAKGIHPGGKSMVKRCGQDGTDLWLDMPGEKEEHSEYAGSLLENFYLGEQAN